MLNEEIKVSLPERGIAYKKVSGKTYVYYVTETYRNVLRRRKPIAAVLSNISREHFRQVSFEVYGC